MENKNLSTSSFKRFLLTILLPLILLVGIVGWAFDWIFTQKVVFSCELCGAYKVNRMLTEQHPDEIPIIGSSRAKGGFIPDSLGGNYFNYGLSGSRFDVALFFIGEECRKNKPGIPIIVELDLEGLYYNLGNLANYIPDAARKPVKQMMGKQYKPVYSIPFLRYFGRFENYYREYLNEKVELTSASNKGAALLKNELTAAEFNKLVAARKKSSSEFYVDSSLLKRLLAVLKQNPDREFIFIVAPYHPSFYVSYKNIEGYQHFLSLLLEQKNATVLDFGQMPLADSMYFNTTHVNFRGAIAFNKVLKDTLPHIIADMHK